MKPLSEEDALRLLSKALAVLGDERFESARADTALTTARLALSVLAASLTNAIEQNEEELRGVIEPRIEPSTVQ